jgi:branched-chain amino acid transport system substrate-binding protein
MVDNYPFASPDLTSMIVKASAFKPEAVICDSYLVDALLITRTMAEQELKPLVYATGGGGHVQPDFLAGAGPLAEGIIAAVVWDAGIGAKVPWIAKLNDEHVKRFGAPFTEDSAAYYQNFYVVVDALRRINGTLTAKTLRDALAATDITDPDNRAMLIPYRRLHFDETGQNPDATAFAVQWQHGKLKLLYPDEYADASATPIWPYQQD